MTRLQRFLLIASLATAPFCRADTLVSGNLTTTTWTKAASPYVLTAPVRVLAGETLTIEPGVTIRQREITINGRLVALGTREDSIIFEGTRVVFENALPSQMRFARVSDVSVHSELAQIDGGGVSVVASPVVIARCVLTRNSADLTNHSYYTDNMARGGGLAAVCRSVVQMDSCDVSGNTATGLSRTGQVRREAKGHGGGLFSDENSDLLVTNSRICRNTSNGLGTAVAGRGLRLSNCLVVGNKWLPDWGSPPGAPFTAGADSFMNCTFSGNVIKWYEYYWTADPCVAYGTLTNCIVRSDSGKTVSNSCTARYCNIQMDSTDVFPGEGNINADPLFADTAAGDFSLLPGSPCIDAGDPASALDLDGTRADMGASPLRPATQEPRLQTPVGTSLSRARPETLRVVNPSAVAVIVDSVTLPHGFFLGTKLPFAVEAGGNEGVAMWFSGTVDTTETMLLHWHVSGDDATAGTNVVSLRITLGTAVCGAIYSTTWTKCGNPYIVTGPCCVPAGEELRIGPGVVVEFDQYLPFLVEGRIHAEGAEGDSIRFQRGRAEWAGVHVSGGDSSSFSQVVFFEGRGDRNRKGMACPTYPHGGGLCVCGAETRALVSACAFRGNHATAVCRESRENWSLGFGGAVFVGHHASVHVSRCTFAWNEAGEGGAAICVRDTAKATIAWCLFWQNMNRAWYDWGMHAPYRLALGIVAAYYGSSCTIERTTIAMGRSYHTYPVRCVGSSVSMTNVISYGVGQVMRDSTGIVEVRYSNTDSYGEHNEGEYIDYIAAGAYPGEGNICMAPLYVDPINGDFSLKGNSAGIDQGDPTLTDPDGSRSDMGAIPFTHPVSVATDRALAFDLRQNLPNPFNPVTTIPYAIAEAGPVTLSVYNLQGQLVRTLVQEVASPGEHTAVWDGRDFAGRAAASGVYLCRLVAPEGVRTMRMTLVK